MKQSMKPHLVLLTALMACAGGLAQQGFSAFDPSRARAHAQVLGADLGATSLRPAWWDEEQTAASFGAEELTASSALGTQSGNTCSPNAWGWAWALCDGRRGLVCGDPGHAPGLPDSNDACLCVAGSSFDKIRGRCINGQGHPPRVEGPVVSRWENGIRPSAALGANPGDACSPSADAQAKWARCETARGLSCVRPVAGATGPATCRCPPGAAFVEGSCMR